MARKTAPDAAVCTALQAHTELGLRYGYDLRRGPERDPSETRGRDDVPHRCVFALTTGGDQPTVMHDNVSMLSAYVAVMVRSDPDRFEEGQELARDVWFALHLEALTGYTDCRCTEAEPRYQRQDDTNHHVWIITVRLTREEAV